MSMVSQQMSCRGVLAEVGSDDILMIHPLKVRRSRMNA
jgi:hypothetical protein